jgi:hypothetical protein
MAGTVVAMGVVADGVALGHALRREWWPAGIVAMVAARKSKGARLAVACMFGPILLEWAVQVPDIDLGRYTALRLAEDVAYGSGVLASVWSEGILAPLVPDVHSPWSSDRHGTAYNSRRNRRSSLS